MGAFLWRRSHFHHRPDWFQWLSSGI